MSGYYVKLGHTIRILFGTTGSTGAATNADSSPTVTVYEQGTALGYSPTVTNKATGLYEAAIDCTTGNGFEVGKEYSVGVAATVGAVTGRDGIGSFAIAAVAPDDLATVVATGDIQARLPAALVGGRIDSSVGAVANNAITAAAIATDAIDGDAIAASAVTELQVGLATAASQTTLATAVAGVQADTDDIQARLPAALVGGRIDASIGAVAADAITAAGLAADVTTELQAGLATAASQTTILNALGVIDDFLDTEIASIKTTVEALPDSAANAAAVLAAVIETGFTLQRVLKIIAAAVAGKKTGDVFRNLGDTQDQITGTSDEDGDRTAATYGA